MYHFRQAVNIPGITSAAFPLNLVALIVQNIPAQVCPNCGKADMDEKVAVRLMCEVENQGTNSLHKISSR